jgi:hypothetical protein
LEGGQVPVRGRKKWKRVWEDECSPITVYTCMKMEKWYLLKLFQEWWKGRIKENGGEGEFKYDIFDTL